MSKHRKRWTSQENLEIVNYYKQYGLTKTKREYEVSSTSIYNWEELYDNHGEGGLSGKKEGNQASDNEELKRLRRENDALKKIVAEKELILRIKDELLKKSK